MTLAHAKLHSWLSAIPSRQDDRGASLVEYALLIALIAIVCLVAVNTIGPPTSQGLSDAGSGFGP
jgi:pilus assembly protein Flp/PilA